MGEISQELAAKMEALARRMAQSIKAGDMTAIQLLAFYAERSEEARAIVAELPALVDPDLLAAREFAEKKGWYTANMLPLLRSGGCDGSPLMGNLVEAIRLGRQLAAEGR